MMEHSDKFLDGVAFAAGVAAVFASTYLGQLLIRLGVGLTVRAFAKKGRVRA